MLGPSPEREMEMSAAGHNISFLHEEHPPFETLPADARGRHLSFDSEGGMLLVEEPRGRSRLRMFVKRMLEDPESSIFGRLFHRFVVLCIGASVMMLVLETVKSIFDWWPKLFTTSDEVFAFIFLAEILLRMWTWDSCRAYFSDPWNTVDILATLPWFLQEAVVFIATRFTNFNGSSGIRMLRIVRTMRLLRVLRNARGAKAANETVSTVYAALADSMEGVLIMSLLMSTFALIAATIMYLLERGSNTQFDSIPAALWWAFATLTTVGYGDVYPVTTAGKCFGIVVMIGSTVVVSVAVAIFAMTFDASFRKNKSLADVERLKKASVSSRRSMMSSITTNASSGLLPVSSLAPESLPPRSPPARPQSQDLPRATAASSSGNSLASRRVSFASQMRHESLLDSNLTLEGQTTAWFEDLRTEILHSFARENLSPTSPSSGMNRWDQVDLALAALEGFKAQSEAALRGGMDLAKRVLQARIDQGLEAP